MMETVDALARQHPNPPLLLAPSCSDSDLTDGSAHDDDHPPESAHGIRKIRLRNDCSMRYGDAASTGGDRWIWSYHNYADTERGLVPRRRSASSAGRRGLEGPATRRRPRGLVHRRRLPGGRHEHALRRARRAPLTEAERRHYKRSCSPSRCRAITSRRAPAPALACSRSTRPTPTRVRRRHPRRRTDRRHTRPALKAWCDVPEYHAAPVQRAAWRPQF